MLTVPVLLGGVRPSLPAHTQTHTHTHTCSHCLFEALSKRLRSAVSGSLSSNTHTHLLKTRVAYLGSGTRGRQWPHTH